MSTQPFFYLCLLDQNAAYAIRYCNANGTWDSDAFSPCSKSVIISSTSSDFEHTIHIIWVGGYLLSSVSLIISIVIFKRIKWVSIFNQLHNYNLNDSRAKILQTTRKMCGFSDQNFSTFCTLFKMWNVFCLMAF